LLDVRGPLLSVKDLNAWYGESHILHGVNFEVHQGEVVTLLGRNGAGKTTTMKSITGIVCIRAGSGRYESEELMVRPRHAMARAVSPRCRKGRGILASLTVAENLLLPPEVKPGGLSLD